MRIYDFSFIDSKEAAYQFKWDVYEYYKFDCREFQKVLWATNGYIPDFYEREVCSYGFFLSVSALASYFLFAENGFCAAPMLKKWEEQYNVKFKVGR